MGILENSVKLLENGVESEKKYRIGTYIAENPIQENYSPPTGIIMKFHFFVAQMCSLFFMFGFFTASRALEHNRGLLRAHLEGNHYIYVLFVSKRT